MYTVLKNSVPEQSCEYNIHMFTLPAKNMHNKSV